MDGSLVAAATVAVLLGVTAVSPSALVTIILDGLSAAAVLAPAVLGGLWLVPVFHRGVLPLRWHFLLGAALGVGTLSQMVLALGLAGVLQRRIWVCIASVAAIAGFVRLRMLLVGKEAEPFECWRELSSLTCHYFSTTPPSKKTAA